MSERVLWQGGRAVHLEAEAEVGAAGDDDRDVDPDLDPRPPDLDAALVVAPVALRDGVAVVALEALPRPVGAAALSAGRAGGVLGIVGDGQRQGDLPQP